LPRLQVLNGKRQGTVFEIPSNSEHLIGHRATATITIDDPWVSWDHARVFFDGPAAECWIEDLGSTNGTYVNCVRVKKERLKHEDIVFLGKTHVIFLAPAEEMGGPLDMSPLFGTSDAGNAASEYDMVLPETSSAHSPALPFHLQQNQPTVRMNAADHPARFGEGGLAPSGGYPPVVQPPHGSGPPPPIFDSHERSAASSDRLPGGGGFPGGRAAQPSEPLGKASGGYGVFDPFEESGADLLPPRGPAPGRPSGHPGHGSSKFGAFQESGSHVPLRDPFASAPASGTGWGPTADPFAEVDRAQGGGWTTRQKDPFADSSVDPFSSGPDFSESWEEAPSLNPGAMMPQIPPSSLGSKDDSAKRRALAETNADVNRSEEIVPRSLSLSDLQGDDDDFIPAGPSTHEISQLIEQGYDDLLGAEPIPLQAPPQRSDPASRGAGINLSESGRPVPSEMRTRQMIDATEVERMLAEEEARQEAEDVARAAGVMVDSGSRRPAEMRSTPQPANTRAALAQTLQDEVLSASQEGEVAYERARLEAEVHRLRAALQAANHASPDAVRAAVAALRDQELARLGQRVADLEKELVKTRHTLEEREAELDAVSEEMIEKEDQIDTLQDRLRRLQAAANTDPGSDPYVRAGGPPARPAAPVSPPSEPRGLEDDLSSLEF
jgi:FHA domain